jgi:hypothetical protein
MPKQKLSAKARKAKLIRDLAAAKTDSRRRKKAENQRKRRAAKKKYGASFLKGKDYDHNTSRFISIKANRGNRGKGTKKEG